MKTEAARRGEALLRPWPPGVIWWFLGVLVVLYALHQAVGLGSNKFFDEWVNNVLLWTSVVVCFLGALRTRRNRVAWLLVSAAMACWAGGDTIWSIRFDDSVAAPLTSVSDIFWLAWYPLIATALVLLARDRVPGFEIHRCIDGVAVMLVVATPWAALVQPLEEHSSGPTLAHALDYVYPLADFVLVGAALGIIALMAWHPGEMWLAVGIALTGMGVGDAIYSVLAEGHVHNRGVYDVAWAAGAVVLAYAAWEPRPEHLEQRTVTGWPAIVLPLAIQVLGAGIQAYAFVHEIPRAERLLTVLVMLLAAVQIVITRPRAEPESADDRGSSMAEVARRPPPGERAPPTSAEDDRGVGSRPSGPKAIGEEPATGAPKRS